MSLTAPLHLHPDLQPHQRDWYTRYADRRISGISFLNITLFFYVPALCYLLGPPGSPLASLGLFFLILQFLLYGSAQPLLLIGLIAKTLELAQAHEKGDPEEIRKILQEYRTQLPYAASFPRTLQQVYYNGGVLFLMGALIYTSHPFLAILVGLVRGWVWVLGYVLHGYHVAILKDLTEADTALSLDVNPETSRE